jgi:hypothetical protein
MYSTDMTGLIALQVAGMRFGKRQRQTHQTASDAMGYSALHRCSGCSLTFESLQDHHRKPIGQDLVKTGSADAYVEAAACPPRHYLRERAHLRRVKGARSDAPVARAAVGLHVGAAVVSRAQSAVVALSPETLKVPWPRRR